MRAINKSVTGAGSTAPIPMDTYISPFNVGVGITVTGTVTYTVQHTFDDVFAQGFDPATATWFNHPTLTGSASLDGNYAFPVTAIRVTNAGGSTGTTKITIVQAGLVGA